MSLFTYRAKTAGGELVTGTVRSDTPDVVARELRRQGYFPVDIEELSSHGPRVSLMPGRKVSRETLADFFRRMRDLLGAGASMLRSLELLAENQKDPVLADISAALAESVTAGASLAESMEVRPDVFSPMMVGLVRAGENSGGLEEVFEEIIRFQDEEMDLADKFRALMAYPVIMSVIGLGTLLFFITFIIPRFATVFEDMGQVLPLPTRLLLGLGDAVSASGFPLLVLLFVLLLVGRTYAATSAGRIAIDARILAMPWFGEIVSTLNMSRFSRSLGMILNRGVDMLQALELALASVSNSHIRNRLRSLPVAAEEGGSLSDALRESGVADPLLSDMVQIGEEAGTLGDTLMHIGERYEKRAYYSLRMTVTILEPAIIVAMGILVGFMVLAMILPVMQINLAV